MSALKSLLNIKRWKEDEAKNYFAALLKELADEEKRLLKMEQQFKSVSSRLDFNSEELIDIDEVKRLNEYLGHLSGRIGHQKEVISRKERAVEDARNLLVEATKDKRIFEKLDEKQRARLEKGVRKKEQNESDEQTVTRHGRRRT